MRRTPLLAPAALLLGALALRSCALPESAAAAEITHAPEFRLNDHLGGSVALSETLAKGPALLVFYRGDW